MRWANSCPRDGHIGPGKRKLRYTGNRFPWAEAVPPSLEQAQNVRLQHLMPLSIVVKPLVSAARCAMMLAFLQLICMAARPERTDSWFPGHIGLRDSGLLGAAAVSHCAKHAKKWSKDTSKALQVTHGGLLPRPHAERHDGGQLAGCGGKHAEYEGSQYQQRHLAYLHARLELRVLNARPLDHLHAQAPSTEVSTRTRLERT